jgi:plastocyanin domain-containing protein
MKGMIMKALALVLLLAGCAKQEQPVAQQPPAPAPAAQTSSAPASTTAVQEHTIDVAGEFTPASLTLKAGQPARLHFRRGDKASCGDEVVFPDLNIRKKLLANETVTIDLPAQQARTLNFACGMDMMKGTVVVQ